MNMNAYNRLSVLALAVAFAGAAFADQGMNKDDHSAMMDTDGDGSISAAEHAAGARAMFDRMDTDRDGSVSAAEMDAAHARMGRARAGAKSSSDRMAKMDTDGNGSISAAEHAAGAQRMFSAMDGNRDGAVDRAEMAAGRTAMKPPRTTRSGTGAMSDDATPDQGTTDQGTTDQSMPDQGTPR